MTGGWWYSYCDICQISPVFWTQADRNGWELEHIHTHEGCAA